MSQHFIAEALSGLYDPLAVVAPLISADRGLNGPLPAVELQTPACHISVAQYTVIHCQVCNHKFQYVYEALAIYTLGGGVM